MHLPGVLQVSGALVYQFNRVPWAPLQPARQQSARCRSAFHLIQRSRQTIQPCRGLSECKRQFPDMGKETSGQCVPCLSAARVPGVADRLRRGISMPARRPECPSEPVLPRDTRLDEGSESVHLIGQQCRASAPWQETPPEYGASLSSAMPVAKPGCEGHWCGFENSPMPVKTPDRRPGAYFALIVHHFETNLTSTRLSQRETLVANR